MVGAIDPKKIKNKVATPMPSTFNSLFFKNGLPPF